jgi:hypothetical protein
MRSKRGKIKKFGLRQMDLRTQAALTAGLRFSQIHLPSAIQG